MVISYAILFIFSHARDETHGIYGVGALPFDQQTNCYRQSCILYQQGAPAY